MDDDLRRLGSRLGLKPDAHPTVRFVVPRKTPGGHRVGKDEKSRRIAALGVESFVQQGVFVVEHRLQPLPAHVSFTRTINRVADHHIVGGYRLGDGPRRASDAEKPARHFLAGADLGERTVFPRVQIDLQGLLVGAGDLAVHSERIIHQVAGESTLKRSNHKGTRRCEVAIEETPALHPI